MSNEYNSRCNTYYNYDIVLLVIIEPTGHANFRRPGMILKGENLPKKYDLSF